MKHETIAGCSIVCDKRDIATLNYKLNGLPLMLRDKVASQYADLYQTTYRNYLAACGDSSPVIDLLGQREARRRANGFLASVLKHLRTQVGEGSTLEAHVNFKLKFLSVWEQHAPDSLLLAKEKAGALDTDSAKALRLARRNRNKAVKALCAAENIPYPSGTGDSADGNGSRFNRLVNHCWLKGRLQVRTHREKGERARLACRIGKHGEHYLTDDEYQQWQEARASGMQYIKDTVFISHEDDEVEMLDVYNSTTANPKNRKIQLMTQVNGYVTYAEKHGFTFAMITPTAASEHHPAPRWEDGKLILNPRYNKQWTVKRTHEHLNAISERVFSALEREGIEFFAFKGVEAHKDGTPHHHFGFFYKDTAGNKRKVHKIFTWYYQELDQLAGDFGDYQHRRKISKVQQAAIRQHLRATQPGAEKRRVTFVYHDASKGSLSNYILKSLLNYVVKDVAVGADDPQELTPKQQENAARQQRLAAWANLHGIRQFSTLRTKASVGVYQELRRIHQPVADSVQLEQERLACVGSFGTPEHDDDATRVNADYCRYMELRRHPLDGATPVALWKVTETESDNLTIRLNEYSDEVGRVQGVRCEETAGVILEVNTRPIKWRAVNVPMLLNDLVNSVVPAAPMGEAPTDADINHRAELTTEWQRIVTQSRTDKTLHELARGLYHHPLSPKVGIAFSARVQPVATWKIRNNPTFSAQSPKTPHNQPGGCHVSQTP